MQALHSGSVVQLKVVLLLHKRTTFIRSIKECTVYNEHEAQAQHSGSVVQLKVGLLLHKRTTFIKDIKECASYNEQEAQAWQELLLHRRTTSIKRTRCGIQAPLFSSK